MVLRPGSVRIATTSCVRHARWTEGGLRPEAARPTCPEDHHLCREALGPGSHSQCPFPLSDSCYRNQGKQTNKQTDICFPGLPGSQQWPCVSVLTNETSKEVVAEKKVLASPLPSLWPRALLQPECQAHGPWMMEWDITIVQPPHSF